jgi:dihydropteroate synthase
MVTLHISPTITKATQLITSTGASLAGARQMLPKAISLLVDLGEITPSLANIIKQEALSIGADAAVHEKTTRCKITKTKVILIGNLAQLTQLAEKLQKNIGKLPKIGQELASQLLTVEN